MKSKEVFMVPRTSASLVAGATRMPPRRWSGDETNFRRCLYKSDLVTGAGTVSAATRFVLLSPSRFLSQVRRIPCSLHRTRVQNPLVPLTICSSNSPLKASQKGGQYLLDGF